MNILILDNYDSFTYNLVQYVKELQGLSIDVKRNDAITVFEVSAYDCIIISPGPGIPSESGITLELIKEYFDSKPILGVCLGLQAIVEAFGGEIYNMDEVYHGISTDVEIIDNEDLLFQNINSPFKAGRYHSWAAVRENFPAELNITAVDSEGSVMALKHKSAELYGVQFHPESILTPEGKKMLRNFLAVTEKSIQG